MRLRCFVAIVGIFLVAQIVLPKWCCINERANYVATIAIIAKPCRMLAPVIEEIASENEGKIKVGKVNVDENPDLARKYRVMSIPTVLVFKNGELTATSVGVDSKENILKLLEK